MASAASSAANAARRERDGPAVMAAAVCGEQVLNKGTPSRGVLVQVEKHPCGATAFLAPHNLPSLVRDRARIGDDARRTATCVEERNPRGYHAPMAFPQTRLRRLRRTPVLRDVVRETRLDAADFVLPLFVEAGLEGRAPVGAMPGVDRLSISQAVAEAGEAAALGLPAVLLFGIPAHKDEEGSGAWDDEGIIPLATRAIKDAHPDLLVIADLCLC